MTFRCPEISIVTGGNCVTARLFWSGGFGVLFFVLSSCDLIIQAHTEADLGTTVMTLTKPI